MTRVALLSLWTTIDKPEITCQKMISHPETPISKKSLPFRLQLDIVLFFVS